jgi:hypothetical protein
MGHFPNHAANCRRILKPSDAANTIQPEPNKRGPLPAVSSDWTSNLPNLYNSHDLGHPAHWLKAIRADAFSATPAHLEVVGAHSASSKVPAEAVSFKKRHARAGSRTRSIWMSASVGG